MLDGLALWLLNGDLRATLLLFLTILIEALDSRLGESIKAKDGRGRRVLNLALMGQR